MDPLHFPAPPQPFPAAETELFPFSHVPFAAQPETPKKKKRGRPKKESGVASGLATSAAEMPRGSKAEGKRKGRPPGSGKKKQQRHDSIGSFGVGFTPHVIMVNAGEDIASKILDFSQQGPRTVCILSANGAVSNVTFRQPSVSGGTMTYEGRYEIISLSGSYLLSESNGSRSRTGGLSVSLAGSDGHLLGGGIAGVLRAAVPVQVIVGSFIADGKKPKSGPSSASPTNMLNFSEPLSIASPPSQPHSSESDKENGNANFNGGPAFYNVNNNNNVSQAFNCVPMHQNMVWSNPMAHMLPQ